MGERDGWGKSEPGRERGGEAQAAPASPEAAAHAMRVAAAGRRRRKRHKFQRLTGIDPTDSSRLVVWQIDHGLDATGKFGDKDLEAARKSLKAASAPAASAGTAPASSPAATPKGGAATIPPSGGVSPTSAAGNSFAGAHGDALLDQIAGGATRQENADDSDEELRENLKGGGETMKQAGEAAHILGGKEMPWLKLAMAPALLNLLREGHYSEAANLLISQVSPSEALEGLLYATKHLGLHVAVEWLEGLVNLVPAADAMEAVIEWELEGFEQIIKAHERGDRDNRIRLYGRGFAEGFLCGESGEGKAILSAVTTEEVEAVRFGLTDGSKTAGRAGLLAADIGRELLRRYGDAEGAKRALLDALGKKAGLPGVWSNR